MLKTLPRIVDAEDYHILKNLPDDVYDWTGLKVKCEELGFCNNYIGIVYQGRLPNKKTIERLLKEKDIVFEED